LRDKIDAFVDFPIEGLDLGERVEERRVAKKWIEEGHDLESLGINDASTKEPLLYDLYAVDEHLGGLGGGHYRAYAKNFQDGHWYHFDDTHVTNSTAKDSVNSSAYLLFYRRRTEKPLGGKLHEKVEEYRKKVESGELPDAKVESTGGPNGVVNSKSLDQEYSSSFVHTVSPDHSPPEHNEYYNGRAASSSHMIPGLELGSDNPFDIDPPDFDSSFNDNLLSSSTGDRYMFPTLYSNHVKANSASSSNEANSPASSFGRGHRGLDMEKWDQDDDPMDDIPDLEDVDTYQSVRQQNHLDEIDSDHLDDEPGLSVAPGSSKAITPPLTTPSPSSRTPAREAAPSPPANHEELNGA
jgi:ubiquitin carboxyl-terminal hydrolase 4/11/15